jgi:hypothetical protein
MASTIKHTELTDTLAITECTDGYWLYDTTRGFNLAMRAKTEQSAFVEALSYYQNRLRDIESAYKCLDSRVQSFVSQFTDDNE